MNAIIFFISEFRSRPWTITDLCQEAGISRTAGYKYLHRFEKYGMAGLIAILGRPKNSPETVNLCVGR